MTAQGSPRTRFSRALERRSVFLAETAARELGRLDLEEALELVVLYGTACDRKYGRAAARLVGRVALERDASLEELVRLASALIARDPGRARAALAGNCDRGRN